MRPSPPIPSAEPSAHDRPANAAHYRTLVALFWCETVRWAAADTARHAALAQHADAAAACLADAALDAKVLEMFPTTDPDAARAAGCAEVRVLGEARATAWRHQRRCVDPAGRIDADAAGLRAGSAGGGDRHGPLGRRL